MSYLNKLVMFYAQGVPYDMERFTDDDKEFLLVLLKQRKDEENNFLAAQKIAEEAGWKEVIVREAGLVDHTINDHDYIYLAKQSAWEYGSYIVRYRDIFPDQDPDMEVPITEK